MPSSTRPKPACEPQEDADNKDPLGRDVSVWTPRPHHPDEPACWSWPIPTVVQDVDAEFEAFLAWLTSEARAQQFRGWPCYHPAHLRTALSLSFNP
jgi:hypothetical protein